MHCEPMFNCGSWVASGWQTADGSIIVCGWQWELLMGPKRFLESGVVMGGERPNEVLCTKDGA